MVQYGMCTLMTSRFSSQCQDAILKVKVKTTILEQRKWVNILWIYPPTQDEIVANEGLVWDCFKTRHRSLGETRSHGGSFLIKRWYSVLCHFLQSKSHFSVLEIKWVSLTQVPSYLHSFMCPGEQWSSYSSFAHCSWYQ